MGEGNTEERIQGWGRQRGRRSIFCTALSHLPLPGTTAFFYGLIETSSEELVHTVPKMVDARISTHARPSLDSARRPASYRFLGRFRFQITLFRSLISVLSGYFPCLPPNLEHCSLCLTVRNECADWESGYDHDGMQAGIIAMPTKRKGGIGDPKRGHNDRSSPSIHWKRGSWCG